jgi:hypothetical protein
MPAVAHGEQLRSSLATINSTKKFRCPIPLLPDPDNGIVENRRASGELPHDCPSPRGATYVFGRRRTGGGHGAHVPAPGADHAAHVVASEGFLGRSVKRSCRVRIIRRGRQAVFR